MREVVNRLCNVVTGGESKRYRAAGHEPGPEVTVPHLRLRLLPAEAEELGRFLLEAAARAREVEQAQEKNKG